MSATSGARATGTADTGTPLLKGRPVKRRRGVTSANQAHMLDLVDTGMQSIATHAQRVDAQMETLPAIKAKVDAIHAEILLQKEDGLGGAVMDVYRSISKSSTQENKIKFDKFLMRAMLDFMEENQ